jgi:trk system potassium uptake protein TrkH
MNYKAVSKILSYVLRLEGILMLAPCIVALIYGEKEGWWYLACAAFCFGISFVFGFAGGKKTEGFFAREGFFVVAMSWILMGVFGAIPFVLTGDIPNFVDALFESISGFTTTGGSILRDVEALSKTSLFWRSFTHWIGGMGVLVLLMAILPLAGSENIFMMRAESTGPQVGKMVPKIRKTAEILYVSYFALTVLEIIMLIAGKVPVFDALTTAFGTAGTGGFAVTNSSIGNYSDYGQIVVAVFMMLFGVNFNLYYLLSVRKIKTALLSEELRYYVGIMLATTLVIAVNIRNIFGSFGVSLRYSFFQVSSLMTSTGFSTYNYNTWPELSKTLLVLVSIIGACAGSTGGGIKVSRFVIMLKCVKREIRSFVNPRTVKQIRMDGTAITREVRSSVKSYMLAYLVIYVVSLIIVSLDGFDFTTNTTAVFATFNNTGPGLNMVGPAGNYADFSILSKIVFIFDMLAGRLELYPMLILFVPGTWKD